MADAQQPKSGRPFRSLNGHSGRARVCAASRLERRNLARGALRARAGRRPHEELNVFETAELWLEPATARARASFDGEAAVIEAPLRHRIRPRAPGLVAPERRVVDWRFPPGS
jgi:hypothetical protein